MSDIGVTGKSLAAVLALAVALGCGTARAEEGAKSCADTPVKARGVGFLPSQSESEEAAKKAWLAKAQALFADADWASAKQPDVLCAKQGLYSNCTASAIPCGSKPGVPPEQPKGN